MQIHNALIVLAILAILFPYSVIFQSVNAQDKISVSSNSTNISQEGLTIYVIPPITNEKILPSSLISPSYISKNISITAAPGEFEPASFVIYPGRDIKSLRIKATNLTGAGFISSSNIDIRVVKCWYQAGINITDTEGIILTPELLLKDDKLVKTVGFDNYLRLAANDSQQGTYIKISDPMGIEGIPDDPAIGQFPVKDTDNLQPVDIPSLTNKQIWVTIKVPNDTQAGNYKGKIILETPDGPATLIDLNVNVLPIILYKPYLIYSIYYLGVLENIRTIDSITKNQDQFRSEMKDLLDHGVSNPTLELQNNLSDAIQIRKETGLDNKTLYYTGLKIDDYGNNLNYLNNAVTDLKKSMAHYGISEVYIYAPDEESLNNNENRNQINLVHKLGVKVFDAQGTIDDASSVADVLDLAVAHGDPDIDLAHKYHSYGHKLFSYHNPQVGVEQPETYRRNYGLLLWQRDYDGAMDYAYQDALGNIWNDFDNPVYRDHVFAYPTMNGVIDTIEWEGWREGVDDVRYLTTLLETIKRAKEEGKDTTDAENWIAKLKTSDLTEQDLSHIRTTMINLIISLSQPPSKKIEGTSINETIEAGNQNANGSGGGKASNNIIMDLKSKLSNLINSLKLFV